MGRLFIHYLDHFNSTIAAAYLYFPKINFRSLSLSGRKIPLKNFRFLISDQFNAERLAEDLRTQLEVNRLHHVTIVAVSSRNEVIVQVPEANDSLEEVVEGFMEGYQTGVILE